MKSKTKVLIGLIAGIIVLILVAPSSILLLMMHLSKAPDLINILFALLAAIPIIVFPIYILSLFKNKKRLAFWAYYLCVAYFILRGAQFIFYGWFVKESNVSVSFILLLVFIATVTIVLFSIPFY